MSALELPQLEAKIFKQKFEAISKTFFCVRYVRDLELESTGNKIQEL